MRFAKYVKSLKSRFCDPLRGSMSLSELIFIAAVITVAVAAVRGEFSREKVYALIEGKTLGKVITDRGEFVPVGDFQVGKVYYVNIRRPLYGKPVLRHEED